MVRQLAAEGPLGHHLSSEQHCETSLFARKVDFLANVEQMADDDLSSFAHLGRGRQEGSGFSQTPAETWSVPPGTKAPSQGGKSWLFWLFSSSWQSNYLLNCDPVSEVSRRRLLVDHHIRTF